ncbi:hypothetical protein HXX76_000114 [Chlamydomonas incerta]|uniref:Uncharacterized protein n=1 Tax=Chlamydomonas incerta TaxID=51695 RepID=A0A835WDR2_CHLIN|nr:hypothetical protein HXX76_000114 [Chlamydomonas incerta]|eukprot:KAG2445498.1 hypothetical protein HXX76_000114 [Chlamydomonas incerta]
MNVLYTRQSRACDFERSTAPSMARLQFAAGPGSGSGHPRGKGRGAEPQQSARAITAAMLEAAEAEAGAEEAAAASAATAAAAVRSIAVKEQPKFGSVLLSPSYRRMSESGGGGGRGGGGGGAGFGSSASFGRESSARAGGSGGGGLRLSLSVSGSGATAAGLGNGVNTAARPQTAEPETVSAWGGVGTGDSGSGESGGASPPAASPRAAVTVTVTEHIMTLPDDGGAAHGAGALPAIPEATDGDAAAGGGAGGGAVAMEPSSGSCGEGSEGDFRPHQAPSASGPAPAPGPQVPFRRTALGAACRSWREQTAGAFVDTDPSAQGGDAPRQAWGDGGGAAAAAAARAGQQPLPRLYIGSGQTDEALEGLMDDGGYAAGAPQAVTSPSGSGSGRFRSTGSFGRGPAAGGAAATGLDRRLSTPGGAYATSAGGEAPRPSELTLPSSASLSRQRRGASDFGYSGPPSESGAAVPLSPSGAGRSPSRRYSATGGGSTGGLQRQTSMTRRSGGLLTPGGGGAAGVGVGAGIGGSGALYGISEHRPATAEPPPPTLMPAGSFGRGGVAASAGASDWGNGSLRASADQAQRLSRRHSVQGEGLTASLDGLRASMPRRSPRVSDSSGLAHGLNSSFGSGSAKLLQPARAGSSTLGPGGGGSSYSQLQRAASSDLAGLAVLQAALSQAGAGPAPGAQAGAVQEHEEEGAAVEAVPFRVQPPATAPPGATRPWRSSGFGGRAA